MACLLWGVAAAIFTVPVIPDAGFEVLAAVFSALVFFADFFSLAGSTAATFCPFTAPLPGRRRTIGGTIASDWDDDSKLAVLPADEPDNVPGSNPVRTKLGGVTV